jgi:aryl-alcohol dehydrogenase-like predicted oxidoreductase
MKLAVGAVQMGLTYGIANRTGKLSGDAVVRVLDLARRRGIDTIDTAAAYGESEGVLGRAGVEGFRVVTKVPPIRADSDPARHVRDSLEQSLRRLGTASVDALLLHRGLDLAEAHGPALHAALRAEREAGRVRRIGISVYGPEELGRIPDGMHLDVVQAPMSVIDRRMERSGWLDRLAARGTAFHARSLFLQGLLLMEPARRPPRFGAWRPTLEGWDRHVADSGLGAAGACLAPVVNDPRVERAVIGVDSPAQLEECVDALERSLVAGRPAFDPGSGPLPEELIDPRCWSCP